MPIWKRQSDDERAREEFQERSLKEIRYGFIPLVAQERLKHQAAMGGGFFSSDLSVGEFMLCRQGEFQTLGQVLGTCFHLVPYYEQGSISNAYYWAEAMTNGYSLAIQRLRLGAKLLNAHGVIGVRMHQKRPEWEKRLAEFTAIGTAIKLPDFVAGPIPFTSTLNGQEFWQLYQQGYLPKDVAYGFGAAWSTNDYETRMQLLKGAQNLRGNVEIDAYTKALCESQAQAKKAFASSIEEVQGDGAVGVTCEREIKVIEEPDEEDNHFLATFQMRGTVVIETHKPVSERSSSLTMDLRDKNQAEIME